MVYMNSWDSIQTAFALDASCWQAFRQEVQSTATPSAVFERLANFVESHGNHPEHMARLRGFFNHAKGRKGLAAVLGNSPFLAHVMHKWPEFLEVSGFPSSASIPSPAALSEAVLALPTRDAVAQHLRLCKQKAYLSIGLRDLGGEATFTETVHALSDLADACLEAGYRWLDRWLSSRYGRPMVEVDSGENGQILQPAQFVILAMGKLGARELNFSSDVDLIYIYSDDRGATQGPNVLAIKSYYNRLGQELIKLLSEPTGDGFVFRLDLRLRPEGTSGDLALSRRSAEIYYEAWGQTWERSAMIKARPVAGDLDLGETLLNNLQPFVFRRYLDFASLDAIREMKHKIDRQVTGADDYQYNIKLGYGGIREIEFFVQSQQLIHGGKHPELRHRQTLATLNQLAEIHLLDAKTAIFLADAYVFLRTVEHRIQIEWERQSHSIPVDPEAFTQLAKRVGLSHGDELRQRLDPVRDGVHKIYGNLFFEGERQQPDEDDPLLKSLFACDLASDTSLEVLKRAGFREPTAVAPALQRLRDGSQWLSLTEHDRLWYDRILWPLLSEVLMAPDPDMALQHAEEFLKNLGHRVNYLAMLLENPSLLRLLCRLFGASPLLAKFFIRHPELMDGLISPGFFADFSDTPVRGRSQLLQSLKESLVGIDHIEDHFDAIRHFKNTELLRIGVRDISGLAELDEVMTRLSTLAGVILTQVLEDAHTELVQRHGEPQFNGPHGRMTAPFAIVAMGKLGGGELNYASDLDLIFIHGGAGDDLITAGPNRIPNRQFFTRLGQKIITNVTTLTKNGVLYELDMRLRPSGSSGPLVTSLDAFLQYHRLESWVWEHQALTRARVVAGNTDLATEITKGVREIITRTRDPDHLRQEVMDMRQRIYQEKRPAPGWIDIKQSRGGIVDVEFLVQFLLLAHGAKHPDILNSHTARALYAIGKAGILGKTECSTLEQAYGFYRLVENRLRLVHDRSENRIGPSVAIRERLRRLCDLPVGEDVVTILARHFDRVKPIVEQVLGLI